MEDLARCVCVCVSCTKQSILAQAFAFYTARGVVALVCVCAFLCSSFFYLFRNDQWQH